MARLFAAAVEDFLSKRDGETAALLREQLNAACLKRRVRVHYPELHLCTDNGAMIALAAGLRFQAGLLPDAAAAPAYHFDVRPRWPLSELG